MQTSTKDEIVPIVIDLGAQRKNELNESFLTMFGGFVEIILRRMFGGSAIPVTVRGSRSEVNSFTNTLAKEKNYMNSFKQYGLDDPKTYKSKYALEDAVKKFEMKTKLKWPFK